MLGASCFGAATLSAEPPFEAIYSPSYLRATTVPPMTTVGGPGRLWVTLGVCATEFEGQREPFKVVKTAEDYLNHVTAWHATRPKFMDTVEFSVAPFADGQAFLADMPKAFDLDTAIGAQLDVLGQWIGVSRYVNVEVPLPYVVLDSDDFGCDGPDVYVPGYPTFELMPQPLDDDEYRWLLRARILSNQWDGTIESAQAAFGEYFIHYGFKTLVNDTHDMSYEVLALGRAPAGLQLFVFYLDYITIHPGGIKVRYFIPSIEGMPYVGCDIENTYMLGIDAGAVEIDPRYKILADFYGWTGNFDFIHQVS